MWRRRSQNRDSSRTCCRAPLSTLLQSGGSFLSSPAERGSCGWAFWPDCKGGNPGRVLRSRVVVHGVPSCCCARPQCEESSAEIPRRAAVGRIGGLSRRGGRDAPWLAGAQRGWRPSCRTRWGGCGFRVIHPPRVACGSGFVCGVLGLSRSPEGGTLVSRLRSAIRRRTAAYRHPSTDGPRQTDVGRRIPDVGYRIPDVG